VEPDASTDSDPSTVTHSHHDRRDAARKLASYRVEVLGELCGCYRNGGLQFAFPEIEPATGTARVVKTAREIALELGCSRSTVHDRARLLDLVLPTPADPEPLDRDGKPKALHDADAELVALPRVYYAERETGLSRRV